MLKLELSFRGLLAIAAGILILWIVTRLWSVLLLIIVATIFMSALLPYVDWLIRKGFRRSLAVLTVLFTVLLVVAGLFALIVPAMVDEFQDLRDNLPDYATDLEEFLEDFGIEVELSDRAEEIEWEELISGRNAFDFGQQALFFLISAVTVVVLTAYLLADAPQLRAYFYRYIPRSRRDEADVLLGSMERVVGGYIRGQLITSGVIAFFTLVVLLAVGVPNAIAFAVLAGFADIIPLIGAFIAIVPATIAAFQESPTQALIVLGLLLAYQQFEDRWLVPRVYGHQLGLQPLVVLIVVLIGAELLGIPGILLALPATAAGKVLLDYYLERTDLIVEEAEGAQVAAPDDPEPPPAETSEPGTGRVEQRDLLRREPE